ncbi:MAG: cobalamin B12-binding domain-containing protein [Pseudomonadota bacterium]
MRDRIGSLRDLIEAHVVPELIESHSGELVRVDLRRKKSPEVTNADVIKFAETLVSYDLVRAREQIAGLQAAGVTNARLMMALFSPAARYLGDEWTADRRSFADVTTGLGGLQLLLSDVALPMSDDAIAASDTAPRRARLFAFPGEQHTFGALVVSEFLRSAGWYVVAGQPRTQADIVRDVSTHWYDLIGISISAQRHLDELPALIGDIRGRSTNPDVKLIGGGEAISTSERDASGCWGLDGVAQDGPEAVAISGSLVPLTAPGARL